MTEDHPDQDLLERFMRNQAGAQELRRVVRHLLAGCARCSAVTRRLWSLGEALPAERPSPAVFAFGLHRLALLSADLGRGEEALRRVRQARALCERLGDGPTLARLRHLEGKIEERRGETAAAEAAFLEARRIFLVEGLGVEAAAALLDLAVLFAREGRTDEIRRLAEDLLPIFLAGGIRQGVGAALLYFRRLVETGHATLEALSVVSQFVAGPPQARRLALR